MKGKRWTRLKTGTFWVLGKKTENITLSGLHLLYDAGGHLQRVEVIVVMLGALGKGELWKFNEDWKRNTKQSWEPHWINWRFCRGATEGLSPSALGSLRMEADGEVCGQLGTDEEMAKWMRDSKPGEQKIKCLRGPNWPGRHMTSENNWQRIRSNGKSKIQNLIHLKASTDLKKWKQLMWSSGCDQEEDFRIWWINSLLSIHLCLALCSNVPVSSTVRPIQMFNFFISVSW